MGDDKVSQPTAPVQPPTTSQNVQDWMQYLPQVLQIQQQTGGQESAQQLQLLQQYGPQLAKALQEQQQSLYPETSKIQENLARIANQGMTATSMPDWMRKQYQSDFNSQLGSNAGSPMGADYMSRGMQQQLFNQQQYYQQMGQAVSGAQPLTSPQAPQYTNYASTFTPTGIANYNMQGYNSYMPYQQNYQNQMGMLSMMPSQSQRAGQAWGSMLMGGGAKM